MGGTQELDVDGLWDAVRLTADVVWPISDMEYGTREFGVRDLMDMCWRLLSNAGICRRDAR